MAAGNRHLGYKEVLNALEDRSPGTKAAFLFGFLERGHERFATPTRSRSAPTCARAPRAARRRPASVCAFCRLRARATGVESRSSSDVSRVEPCAPFAAGDRVLLVDSQAAAPPRSRSPAGGAVPHPRRASSRTTTSSAHADGTTVRTTRGARLVAVRPTLAEYVLEMPRGAQVIYPKDLGPILMLADIFPGARVLESGVGSGALTMTLLRAIGPTGHVTGYELRDDFADRAPAQRRRLPRPRRAARPSRCATSTTASTSPTSTASCSTCPSRGGS